MKGKYMNCPLDNTVLQISERNGIEIDFCPKCRGVWLDRGELDKIIERANTMYTPSKDYDTGREQPRDYYKGGKKKSFFDDLFDF
jgi:uncharacterized protein